MFSKTYYPTGTTTGGGGGGGITLEQLTPMLVDYVTQTQLTPLALKADLDVTTALAIDSGMKVAEIQTTLTTLALQSDLMDLDEVVATKADISQLPDLSPYALSTQLTPLALKTEIPVVPDLSSFVTTDTLTDGLASKANQSDLTTLQDTVSANTTSINVLENPTFCTGTIPEGYRIEAYTINGSTPNWAEWLTPAPGTAGSDTGGNTLKWTIGTNTSPITYNTTTGIFTNTGSKTYRLVVHAYLYMSNTAAMWNIELWIATGTTGASRVVYAALPTLSSTAHSAGCSCSGTLVLAPNDTFAIWGRTVSTAGATIRGGKFRFFCT